MTTEPSVLAEHHLTHCCGQYLKHAGNGPGKRKKTEAEKFTFTTTEN
jgi:hypothetical protein